MDPPFCPQREPLRGKEAGVWLVKGVKPLQQKCSQIVFSLGFAWVEEENLPIKLLTNCVNSLFFVLFLAGGGAVAGSSCLGRGGKESMLLVNPLFFSFFFWVEGRDYFFD